MSDPYYNAVPPGGYTPDEDELEDEDEGGDWPPGSCASPSAGSPINHRVKEVIMHIEDVWLRLSDKTRERIIRMALYLVFIVVFWLFGPSEKITKATAFFGLAALTGFYNLVFSEVLRILKAGKPSNA